MFEKLELILRKVFWKVRWRFIKKPFLIKHWHAGYTIGTPLSGSAAQIYYRGYSEPNVANWMMENIGEGDCFIDVGAHIGEYAMIAASKAGSSGQIITVEPQEDLCGFIQANFERNKVAEVEVIQAAIGANDGKCRLSADPVTKGATLIQGEAGGQEVKVVSLATVLGKNNGRGRLWIKLDAAGFEIAALDTAWEVLKTHKATLMLKAYNHEEITRRFPDLDGNLFSRLVSHGYRCQVFSRAGLVEWTGEDRGYCQMVLCTQSSI